ncbi:unnamed protein product [Calypogeia fissa]
MSGGGAESGQEAVRSEDEELSPTPQEQEAMLKKKYGGLIPRKPPLISKDHERAFFDSADWALGKQGAPPNPLLSGAKPRSSMEALRPKLQPTPHQPLPARRSSYVAPDGEEGESAEGEPGSAPEGESAPN